MDEKPKVKFIYFFCKKCGHAWNSRCYGIPARCPKCLVRTWNSNKSPKKYNFGEILVGEKRLLIWYSKPNGDPDFLSNVKRNIALSTFCNRTKRKFVKKSNAKGLEIWRVA
jgi:hypothetical protein